MTRRHSQNITGASCRLKHNIPMFLLCLQKARRRVDEDIKSNLKSFQEKSMDSVAGIFIPTSSDVISCFIRTERPSLAIFHSIGKHTLFIYMYCLVQGHFQWAKEINKFACGKNCRCVLRGTIPVD